jgi:predicted outer membrane repeat protein
MILQVTCFFVQLNTLYFTSLTLHIQGGADAGVGISDGNVTFIDTIFNENVAKGSGGSLRVDSGNFIIMNSFFTNNRASQQGGAIAVQVGTVAIAKTVFSSNSIGKGLGGAISTADNMMITNCTFDSNTAAYGGALRYWRAAVVSISNTVFTNNQASLAAGAIHSDITAPAAVMSNNSFSGNTAYCCYAKLYTDHTRVSDSTCTDVDYRENVLSECCAAGTFSDSKNCQLCNSELTCDDVVGANISTLQVASGLWRTSSVTLKTYQCFNAGACSGGVAVTSTDGYCATGYKGPCK